MAWAVILSALWLALGPASGQSDPLVFGPDDDATEDARPLDPDEAQSLAAKILADGYQGELPEGPSPSRDIPEPVRIDLPDWLARPLVFFMRAIVYVLLAVGLFLLCFWLARTLWSYVEERRDQGAAEERPGLAATGAGTDPHLADPSALAAQHRFAEAIHVLLLRSLQYLNRRRPSPLPDSLTSREVLARLALPESARRALETLVLSVEISHFGGRSPDRNDYERCLACAEELQAVAGGGAS